MSALTPSTQYDVTIDKRAGSKTAGKRGEKSAPIRPIEVAKKLAESSASRRVVASEIIARRFLESTVWMK